ncbi:hypothetical protein POUND7_018482 [Theobroma cacao]
MDFHLFPPIPVVIATVFAFPLFLFSLLWISKSVKIRDKKRAAPEAGSSWPVIGHLHLLGGPQPPHIVLGDMAEKYGSIFTIKMGVYRALVVNNWETAKECLTTNDKAFTSRPKTLAMEFLSFEHTMVGFTLMDRTGAKCVKSPLLRSSRATASIGSNMSDDLR